MGTAPREATSIPSACKSSRASPLRNSPQTLWRGVGSRSISVTTRPLRASAIEAAQPATPPPRTRTSPCKGIWFRLDVVAGISFFWIRYVKSVTASGELAPVKAEVNDKQRGKSKGDHADGG